MSYFRSMADIYRRLSDIGFDRKFVLSTTLPARWDDTDANSESGRDRAEASICEALGIEKDTFAAEDTPIKMLGAESMHYLSPPQPLTPALTSVIALATRIAQLCRDSMVDPLSCWFADIEALNLRQMVTEKHRVVTFRSLLETCWALGVPVAPMCVLPAKSISVDAVIDATAGQPVVILSSRHQAPAWMIWHLAHALSHIKTIQPGERIVLADLLAPDESALRKHSTEFATQVIHGSSTDIMDGHDRITGVKLAALAREYSHEHALEVGSVVTGFSLHKNATGGNTRGPADKALNNLGISQGGHQQVSQILQSKVNPSRLPMDAQRIFKTITGYTR